jgi:hypothetical protein
MRLVWNQAALPGASRLKICRRVGDSNSCAVAVRQFSGLLGYQLPIPSACQLLVGQERLELSRPKAPVPKTSVSAIPPPAHWSTEPDSNWLRTGFETAASTAAAFSAKGKILEGTITRLGRGGKI